MKWIVYNLLFALAFPLMLPGFLVRMLRRGGYRARLGDRFALYPQAIVDALTAGDFIWIHAVSVGEVQVAGQLMRDWRAVDPTVRFCFSTTSSTGWKMAEKEVTPADVLIYNPLDFPNFVKSALKTVRPRAVVLTESEIWPVFIRTAKCYGIPLFLINARVSDRSAPRYAKARFFFGDVFSCFTRIFAQSELDRDRLLAAGAPADRVDVTGSFKFDVAHRNPAKEEELRRWIAPEGRKILLGGSTWPGEDEVMLRIYRSILDLDLQPRPLLVLAPRHFEKADAVEANIRKAGFACVRRSRGESAESASGPAVFLADTTGELMGLYGIADGVFVGKSLCEHGSQNMIEPCLCGKPTAVGPYTENFRPVMSDLQEGEGIVQAKDEAELTETIVGWFAKGDGGLGERAQAAVARRTGVVPRCTAAIRAALAGSVKALAALLFAGALAVPALAAAPSAEPVTVKVPAQARSAALPATRDLPKFKAIRTVGAYVAMMERPEAVRVYLADAEAERYAPIFTSVKLRCATAKTAATNAVYDIVFAGEVPADLNWSALTARLNSKGVLACAFDVEKMTAGRFKSILESFPCDDPHLWMPGERDWLLTGRRDPYVLKMGAMLEFFTQSDALVSVEAAEAGCCSAPELFANYVGTRKDVLPAFKDDAAQALVRPEHFLSAEVPDIAWISPKEMDADIVDGLAECINRAQAVRRMVVRGNVLARERKMDEAIEAWSKANVSNPHDTMLQGRLFQLVVNARALSNFGRIADAAQCYDILFAVCPSDLGVAEEYFNALTALRRTEDAAKVRAHIDSRRLKLRMAEVAEREKKAGHEKKEGAK